MRRRRMPPSGERLPPHDREMEAAVLASLMVDEMALPKVAAILRPQDFYDNRHRHIYEACLSLMERREAINEVTVAHELDRRGLLEQVGGVSYLSGIIARLPTPLVAEHYARVVVRDSAYRRLIQVAQSLAEEAYRADDPDVARVVARTQARLVAVLDGYSADSGLSHVGSTLADGPAVPLVVETPPELGSLRQYVPGIARGEVMVVGGDTSVGKSAFGVMWALRAAQVGRRVLYLSAEMPRRDIDLRCVAILTGIPYRMLREGAAFDFDQAERIQEAQEELRGLPMYVMEVGHVDTDRLRALCYRQQVSDGLDLVVVDYLQLLRSGEQHRSEVEEVTAISRKLKALAMDVQVALLSLSQLRRRQAEEKAPTLWDLRQSGAIEQDADYVLLLHWKQRSENTDVGVRSMELYVAKNRHGPLTRPDQPLRYDFEAATGLWREHEGRKGKGLYLGEEQWPV